MPGTVRGAAFAYRPLMMAAVALCGALTVLGCTRRPEFQTIVVITIDTLRADHVGAYGYPRPTTPFLDTLAQQGVVFENAYSSSSHTAPSHASLFTALYPEAHGVLRNGARLAPQRFTTLADSLSGQGFETAAFTGVGFLRQIAQGFDHVDAWTVPKGTTQFRHAEDTISAAIEWLRGRAEDQRLFLWVHIYDVHAHHEREGPHMEFAERMGEDVLEHPGEFEDYLQRTYHGKSVGRRLDAHLLHYDAQLAYADNEIARLYREVRTERPGASLWIITSDHGEGLENHNYMGHGRNLYNEQLRVPLIVHASTRIWEPSRVDRLVRLVDLYPTIQELVAAEEGPRALEGVSLVPLLDSPRASVPIDTVFAQRRPSVERHWSDELVLAAQGSGKKYIYHSGRTDEYYDLTQDPDELVNLVDQNLPEAERLRDWLLEQYARMQRERPETSDEILPEHLDELRTLGYVN